MDQSTLVSELIEDGEKLLKRLVAEGIPVTAAGWVKEGSDGPWYLYIATPLVGKQGVTKKAYQRVNDVRWRTPDDFVLPPLAYKVVSPENPITKAVLEVQQASGRRGMYHKNVGRRINGVDVEEAYVYPAEVAVT
jgi:hypothetical protein